jgi:hypothetical protein
MRENLRHRSAVSILLLLLLPSLALAGKPLDGIPLVWKPTNRKDTGVLNLAGLTNVTFRVDPFTDTRADKTKIGENQEDKTAKLVTTSGNVAEFCTQQFANTLKQYGLTVVPEGGDVVIGGEVLEFMVIETGTYKGEVRLKVSAKRAEREEWVGVASGTSSRFGRSYKADNYYETLSDALLEAAERAVKDEGFRKATAGS